LPLRVIASRRQKLVSTPIRATTAGGGIELSDTLAKELRGKALLIGWDPGPQKLGPDEVPWSAEESMDELEVLCKTLGIETKDRVLQRFQRSLKNKALGKGKIEEVKQKVKYDNEIGVVVFDRDLPPRELLSLTGRIAPDEDCIVMDRTSLILRIFAQRARTNEAKLQVTLASQQYMLPRLRYYLTEGGGLEAKGGGSGGSAAGGGLKGMGESQLNKDRSMLKGNMAAIRKKIQDVRKKRGEDRARMLDMGMPVVGLVGYTNAGKSTLLNRLCGSDEVKAQDRLFETLDPTRRRIKLDTDREVFLIDTVGFIQRLPEQLVAGFSATLEEVSECDCLLHVLDISSSTAAAQVSTVMQTLSRLESYDVQTPQLLVFNKIDKLEDGIPPELDQSLRFPWPGVVGHCQISARTGDGMQALAEAVENMLVHHTDWGRNKMKLLIPYTDGKVYGKIRGPPPMVKVNSEEHTAEGYLLDVTASPDAARRLRPFEVSAA